MDIPKTQETDLGLRFLEVTTDLTVSTRCVDGRPDPESKMGPQMLGGALNPIMINLISSGEALTASSLTSGLTVLKNKGFTPGFHVDNHEHSNACGCGFCDKQAQIITDLAQHLDQYAAVVATLTEVTPAQLEKLRAFSAAKIELTGPQILDTAKKAGVTEIENVQGDHGEKIAFVNFKPNTTFDTKMANTENWQAFNLDVWAVQAQAKAAFNIDEQDTLVYSLFLYLATKNVLADSKPGATPLGVVVNK